MEKNDCFKCPLRGTVAGSAHSSCKLLDDETSFKMAMMCALGKIPRITNNETGEDLLSFNPVGVVNGWCNWPLDFDPVWVTCRIPFKKEKE